GKGHWIGIIFVGASLVLSSVVGIQWIQRSNEPAHTQAEGFADVDPSCSATAAGFLDGSLHEAAAHGTETGHGQTVKALNASSATEGATEYSRPIVKCLHWFDSGGVDIKVGTMVDGQSVLMLFLVGLISLLVHVYSTDYVGGDRRYTHYFAFLSLFTASMMFYVISENTLQMIVGWELIGVCSFALIGHWWEERPNTDAALKAFLTNRVGDAGLLIGMIMLFFLAGDFFSTGGTFNVIDINYAANNGGIGHNLLLVASVALIAAVMSKSGQFILHTWLPDAMAGPTPASALIHAATMVVAGIFMIARLYPVFFEGLSIAGSSINYLAVVGSVTALFGAILGFVQKDIKKALAYSTVSQLGFMVAALGVGAWTAALFHLFTHAMFKACLFLGAGSLSHAAHHSFNMVDDMGGLRKVMPKTFWTYIISMLSLAGVFPLAGFWSKDEIIAGTGGMNSATGAYTFVLVMLLAAAFCTAAYMTRTVYYAFFGEYRGHGHPHESGNRLTWPLMILAFGGAVAGFLNLPYKFFGIDLGGAAQQFTKYVEPVGLYFPGHDQGFGHAEFNNGLALLATVIGLAGIAIPAAFYAGKLPFLENLSSRNKALGLGKNVLENKYYLDWLYTDVIVGFIKGPLARAANWSNQNVLDGVVNGTGRSLATAGRWIYKYIDQGVVDGTVNGVGRVASGT
ncbi:MAG: NADH-quinone oxidoreductase subunit L, partial [Actinobacteria bacterium]|nr:NADH-quinone oxidoreductase subunit L [Actinomycetota bacterium]